MKTSKLFILFFMASLYLISETASLPISIPAVVSAHLPSVIRPAKQFIFGNGRGIWDFIGNWIQQTDWLPIELNVPETFTGFSQNVQGFFSGLAQQAQPYLPPVLFNQAPKDQGQNNTIIIELHKTYDNEAVSKDCDDDTVNEIASEIIP